MFPPGQCAKDCAPTEREPNRVTFEAINISPRWGEIRDTLKYSVTPPRLQSPFADSRRP